MVAIKKHSADTKDESGDHFASRLEALKSSFAQLREDVTKLLANALDTGKDGAGTLKDHASTAVGDVKDRLTEIKDRGVESVERVGHKIGEHSLMSAAIAFAVGFVLAKLLTKR